MRRALELARRGIGLVEPNPAVGAVVVDDDLQVLGEGWHERFGGPHAEVHALAQAGEKARGATLYCTLEPCSHFGKTPPCADAVIAAGIKRVVIATGDPAPHVAGQGIARLKSAGIDVEIGLHESEAQSLIAPFLTLTLQKRPFVTAKWAMSLDGKIATRTGDSKWISGEESRKVAHELRGRMDAILVGIGTVLADDPLLTARPTGPRTPLRIVLDSRARTPLTAQLLRTLDQGPVLIAVAESNEAESNARQRALSDAGAEVLPLTQAQAGRGVCLKSLLAALGRRRLTNLLVEGGGNVHGAFFDAGLVDEVHAFIAPKIIGGDGALSPLLGRGRETVPQLASLSELQSRALGEDAYVSGRIVRAF